jgi:hypothetical protein
LRHKCHGPSGNEFDKVRFVHPELHMGAACASALDDAGLRLASSPIADMTARLRSSGGACAVVPSLVVNGAGDLLAPFNLRAADSGEKYF